MRKPNWQELNLMAKEKVPNPRQWEVVKHNREFLRLRNKKTGKILEVPTGGKVIPREEPVADPSEALARYLRAAGDAH